MSILTNLAGVWLVVTVLFFRFALSDDQNCMNGATKIIPVSVTSDNPNKVMTYVRDDPGYATNLKCRWELRAEDYSKPSQMLLNVTLVDFDTNNAKEEECSKSEVDLFNFTLSGQLSPKDQVSTIRFCSNSDAKKMPRLMLANLWNSSNYLTVEFKSDDRQVRSDAKGVEMDVLIMHEDYCHRSMLYHDGACHLITGARLTFSESLWTAKHLLGNLVTFPTIDSVTRLLRSNAQRVHLFPFKPPFNFASEKVWIGHYKLSHSTLSSYMNRCSQCNGTEATLALSGSQCNSSSPKVMGIAMQVIDARPVFTCESLDTQLPALIEFTQITGANRCSPFNTCNRLPEDAASSLPASALKFGLVLTAICLLVISVIIYQISHIIRAHLIRRQLKNW